MCKRKECCRVKVRGGGVLLAELGEVGKGVGEGWNYFP